MINRFSMFELDPKLVEVLASLGYQTMTPVQEEIIPRALRGESLIVKASTGSGKTHSYLVPLLARLEDKDETQALIIAPTRELARQIYDFAMQINERYKKQSILLLAGGLEKSRNKERLSNRPQLIIATPGRYKDLALDDTITSLKTIKTVIVDEADMLFDDGFFPIISEIIDSLTKPIIQLYSATIPQKLANLVTLKTGVRQVIDLNKENKTNVSVTHYLIDVHHLDRYEVVLEFIKKFSPYLLLIFCSKNKDVLALHEYLSANGIKVGLITGELESRKRKAMLRRIKNNEFSVIVGSDIAARGIDIDNISDIISLDFPSDLEFYFHRAGRTGRFGKVGNAYSFYDHDDLPTVAKLTSLGVQFKYLVFKSDEFKPVRERPARRKQETPEEKELDTKIKKTIAVTRSTKVKPGYKKKVKEAVATVKQRHKRDLIKKSIKKQQAERRRRGDFNE